MLITFPVSKCDIDKLRSEKHPENISFILVTEVVSKLIIFKDDKEEHPEKRYSISVD